MLKYANIQTTCLVNDVEEIRSVSAGTFYSYRDLSFLICFYGQSMALDLYESSSQDEQMMVGGRSQRQIR